ncbi:MULTISPECIES: hypothetical protein [unclassified Pseudoalteromonas]|uniref:hypothetical protein n=1 Tax=unclassified Pseudoalteromonas TaxID=194690 RepID=UPI0030145D2E
MKFNNLAINKLVWLFVFLFPVLPHTLGAPTAQKMLHVFAFAFVFMSLIVRRAYFKPGFVTAVVAICTVLMSYYMAVSLAFTEFLTFKDLPDYLRPLIYLVYILIPLIYPLDEEDLQAFFSFFKKMFVLQIVISMLVYIPAVWPVVDLFKGRPSDDMALHFYRWSGTYGYPSDFSFYLSFFIFYYFCFFARRIAMSLGEWLIVFVAFSAMFLSFSRGGLFSTLGILGLAFWFTGARNRKTSYFLLFSMVLACVAIFLTFSEEFEQVAYILETFGGEDGKIDGSTSHRLKELALAGEYSSKFPPFSQGSNRMELATRIDVIESFYGFHLIKWGVLGLAAALVIKFVFFLVCCCVYKKGVSCGGQKVSSALAFAVACLVASEVLLFGLSSAISDRFKTLPTFYLLFGYVLSVYFVNKDVKPLKKTT